jgi:hypothetical protein
MDGNGKRSGVWTEPRECFAPAAHALRAAHVMLSAGRRGHYARGAARAAWGS